MKLYQIILICCVFLSSCTTVPTSTSSQSNKQALLTKAIVAEKNSDFQTAAREYIQLSNISADELQQSYRIKAATALFNGNYNAQAARQISLIDINLIGIEQIIKMNILQAKLALANRDLSSALDILNAPIPPEASQEDQAIVFSLLTKANLLSGNLPEALRSAIIRHSLVGEPSDDEENTSEIWKILSQLTQTEIENFYPRAPEEVLLGWLEIKKIDYLANANPKEAKKLLAQWKINHPQHAAKSSIVPLILSRANEETARPQHIAILLPQFGNHQKISSAIRDGFLAAHYNRININYQPILRFYDTSDKTRNIHFVVEEAIRNGADFIVGPLRKDHVTAVSQMDTSNVSKLTLNYSTDQENLRPNVYQFGLAPEDEAIQVAQKAWLDGHNQGVALIPNGAWGSRLLKAFEEQWGLLGGTMLEVQRYSANKSDYSDIIKAALNIDTSIYHHDQLEKLLLKDITFEPRRRNDIDFVFIASFPKQARLIRPQLKFHYASTVPVYATSHVFTGEKNRNTDRDLDGINFIDMPWVLENDANQSSLKKQIKSLWPVKASEYKRFLALGIDAYQVIPHLSRMKTYEFENFQGLTGLLSIQNQKIKRDLLWAKFKGGIPRTY